MSAPKNIATATPIDKALDKLEYHVGRRHHATSPREIKTNRANIASWRKRVRGFAATPTPARGTTPTHTESFDFGGMAHHCDDLALAVVSLIDKPEVAGRATILRVVIGVLVEAGRCEITGPAAETEGEASA